MENKMAEVSYNGFCEKLINCDVDIKSFDFFKYRRSDQFLFDIDFSSIIPKKYVILRHDIDHDPLTALKMARIEHKHGIQSTYFVLTSGDSPTLNEWWTELGVTKYVDIMKEMQDLGHEVGIHYDLLGDYFYNNLLPAENLENKLSFFEKYNIKIKGCASHGSSRMRRLLGCEKKPYPHAFMNYNIWKETHTFQRARWQKTQGKYPIPPMLFLNNKVLVTPLLSLKDYNLEYEAYFVNKKIYFSDSGGVFWRMNESTQYNFNVEESLASPLPMYDIIKEKIQPDIIQVLAHPWWWKDKV